jgi:hypothetical protein
LHFPVLTDELISRLEPFELFLVTARDIRMVIHAFLFINILNHFDLVIRGSSQNIIGICQGLFTDRFVVHWSQVFTAA